MLTLSIVLFAAAALGGAYLAALRLKNRPLPMPLALVHGALAAIALVLLILTVLTQSVGGAVMLATVLFVIVALGGFLAFSFHLRGQVLPLPLLGIHGGAAVISFLILLYGVYGG